MPSTDDWWRDWVSEDHLQRQQLSKKAIERCLRTDVQRRVSSSSASSSVSVVDCCWAKVHLPGAASPSISTALAPHLFCALSDGVVCVLNTANFAKVYLFDDHSSRRGQRRHCVAAIDCVPVAPDSSAAIVCAIVDGAVCTFTLNPSSPGCERTVTTRSVHRAVSLPKSEGADLNTDTKEGKATAAGTSASTNVSVGAGAGIGAKGSAWDRASLRFSRSGNRIAAILFSHTTAQLCVLARVAGSRADNFAPALLWTSLPVPGPTDQPAPTLYRADWWDETRLLTVWDDGRVAFVDAGEGKCLFCAFALRSRAERRAGRLTGACATPPPLQPPSHRGTPHTTHTTGAIAMVLDRSVVVVMHVLEDSAGLTLRPAHQTYCSQEISVRDVAFFDSFLPNVLAVLLESGACLILDTNTMEPLHHRPVSRLFPSDGTRKRPQRTEEGGSGDTYVDTGSNGSYYLCPRERPLAMCVVEHNTAIIMRQE